MGVVLYAGSERSSSTGFGRTTRHSFSFGSHYDPANLGFGPLVCHNDDDLAPRAGYPDHPHSGLEIVTWVLEGALVHTDSSGARHVLEAGRAQVLSAGSGIRHSEVADPTSGRCRFIQAWLTSDDPGGTPSYSTGETPSYADAMATVVGSGALPIRTSGSSLSVARLSPGAVTVLPPGSRHHVFAATGSVRLAGETLSAGDAVRVHDLAGAIVHADTVGELMVWSFT